MTTRVLFVDDEPNVLSGLRRLLRGQRKVWDMQFANGGQEALEMMQEQPFDVIVSDMRMPNIDGAELLTRVSQLYPNTVRLVLSGQSEHEKIFRAIGPAHQFLSKPCDPTALVSTIERACGLNSHLQDKTLKDITSRLTTLPSLPNIYRELVAEIESDDASIDRIGQRISADLGMTAKVLQLVNSSFFGLPQHVTCPKHAVSLLGLNVIRPLVLTVKVFSQFDDPGIEGFSLERLIQHSVQVAFAAKQIAEAENAAATIIDDSLIAGMLHDVGKLVLAINLPEDYARVMNTAQHESLSVPDAESKVIGATHAEVGAHLLGLWGLPNPIVEAIAFHHHPSCVQSPKFSPLTAVHAANCLYGCDDTATDELNLDSDYLDSLELSERIESWRELISAEAVS